MVEYFPNLETALLWMRNEVDDPCIDNERVADVENPYAVKNYFEHRRDGCCGSFDEAVQIAEEIFLIGCNYGH